MQRKQPTADEYMRSIKRTLTDAVDACIEAATHEIAPGTQRTLLKVRRQARPAAPTSPPRELTASRFTPLHDHAGVGVWQVLC